MLDPTSPFAALRSLVLRIGLLLLAAGAVHAAPVLSSISGSSPTSGSGSITLEGTGFGPFGSATVLIGGAAATVTAQTDTDITCSAPPGQGANLPVTVTAFGDTSNALQFTYDPPLATAFNTPSGKPTTGGVAIEVLGSNFGESGATVTIGGASAPVISQTHTSIHCSLPPGQGSDQLVTVAVAGQEAPPAFFSYDAPFVASINTPSGKPTAGGVTIEIQGDNFGSTGASVTVGGANAPVISQSHTSILCTLPPGQGFNQIVTVTVAGQASPDAFLSYEAPSVTSIAAPSGKPTAGGVTIELQGENFGTAGAWVTIGGAPAPVISQTHTSIQCTLPPGQGANLPLELIVGGQTPPPTFFSYDAPVVTAIDAPSGKPTTGAVTIELQGNNFGSIGAMVTLGGSPVPVISQTHTSIQCSLPSGQGANLPLVVTVAGQASSDVFFSYDAPAVTAVNAPSGKPTAGGVPIELLGHNFGLGGATVTVGGAVAPVISQTHNSIQCTLPPGQGTNRLVAVSVAGQTSPEVFLSYDAPAVVEVNSPSGLPTAGGVTVELLGSDFGISGAAVTIGGAIAPVISQTHDSIQCTLPPGQGTNRTVSVTVAGQTAPEAFVSYDAPVLVEILVPAGKPTAGGVMIELQGNNFGTTGAAVTIGGAIAPVTFQSHSTIQCTLPSGQGTNKLVKVTVAGQVSPDGLLSYDAPVLDSLMPARALVTSTSQVTLSGSSFGLTPTVTFGGLDAPVLTSSHTSITVQKPVTPVGDVTVTVTTAAQTSNGLIFRSVDLSSLPGYYIDLETEQVLPAPAGHFTAVADAIEPTPAPAGTYCPVPGMQEAIPASPGYYVPVPGSMNQTPADIGSYAPGSGNLTQFPAPTGTFTPIPGCRSAVPAPEGTYSPVPGSGTTLPVPAGFTTTGPGASTLIPLPQITILSFQPDGEGGNTIEFETAAGQDYGIYFSNNLIDYVLLETVAGTGAPASRTVTAPGGPGRGFFVVGPADTP
ncbi:IPT/TIG domain-containing protein [Luteolibacter marinus]|uniref:IPT/TIG domain-containing protein n=1 Tax=Luteolibacter marinus TaxID=2776705 RepID=UPI001866E227|nr:IPT/TIG domain-containing protein [Luteolibacter marinus]